VRQRHIVTAPLDRELLAKVLGPLGSDHDGEVVAAGRTADRMVRDAGLTWPDVVQPRLPTPPPDPVPFGDVGEIKFCLRRWHALSGWERDFLVSIRDQRRPLSTRQRNTLARIVDKLRARAEAA
jgi:hypothetical protein